MSLSRLLIGYLMLPLFCAAVQPYTPTIADPIADPWRWRAEEDLADLGVLCMGETSDGTLWFGNTGSIASYDGVSVSRIPLEGDLLSQITSVKGIPWAKEILVLPGDDLLLLIEQSLVLRSGDTWQVIIKDVGDSGFLSPSEQKTGRSGCR